MAVTVGTNSWITIAEADAILTDRVGATAWFALADTGNPGDESKTAYLITAYHWLVGVFGLGASTAAADALKRAQAEAALFLVQYREEYEKRGALIAGGVEEFTWSRWSESLSSQDVPQNIKDLIGSLGPGYGTGNALVQVLGEDYL